MRVADAHCHLAGLPDPDGAVREAVEAGVAPILAVSMSGEEGRRNLELQERYPGVVLAGVGIHPSRVAGLTDKEMKRELLVVAECAAGADLVGEIGLDFKDARDGMQKTRQRDALLLQYQLAHQVGLPVSLHTRRTDREVLETAILFTRGTGLGASLHWFTHSEKLARRAGEEGVFISVGPSILHDPKQAAVARAIHPDFLLVETDAPVEFAGEAARPAWAARVATELAQIRGEDPDLLQARLRENLARYLRRLLTEPV